MKKKKKKKKRMPKIKIFGYFSSKKPWKKFPVKILVDDNMTHVLKRKKYSKNIYHRRRIILSKILRSSFSGCSCSSSLKTFDAVVSILETANFRWGVALYTCYF